MTRRKDGEEEKRRHTQEHTHTHTQYLVHDSMVFHCLYFKYSQQQHFYNRWWIHQSLLVKAKAKMNPIMRKKHLELQSGWAKRRLSAAWQNSVQREYGQLAVSEEGMSCRSAGSCLEPVMVNGLTFLPPRPSREKVHAHSRSLTWSRTLRQGGPVSAYFSHLLPVRKVQTLCRAGLADRVPVACPIHDREAELDPALHDTKIKACQHVMDDEKQPLFTSFAL